MFHIRSAIPNALPFALPARTCFGSIVGQARSTTEEGFGMNRNNQPMHGLPAHPTRRPYRTPRLEVLGHVAQVTEGMRGNGSDGGSAGMSKS
jgi:hypothetical protein